MHGLIEIAIERHFGAFRVRPAGVFPVGVMEPDVRQWVTTGLRSRVVRLSTRIMRKQTGDKKGFDGHPQLRLSDYQRLPAVIGAPEWVTRPAPLFHHGRRTRERISARLLLLKAIGGTNPQRYDLVVVDPDSRTGTLEVATFYTVRPADVQLLTGARARQILRTPSGE